MPNGTSVARNSTPDPPIAWPAEAPANMKPFATPRSSSGSTAMASASIATSCVAAKALCSRMIAVRSPISVATFTGIAASSVTAMPICVARIHSRRRPWRSEANVSTNGPASHLNAHGRYSEPTNAPMATGPRPARRICVAIAVAVNPSGMPSVT